MPKKVGLLSFYTDPRFNGIADLTLANRDAYCKRHKYIHIVRKESFGPDCYYAIQRLKYLLNMFGYYYTVDLWWVFNIAGVITNGYIPVTEFDKGQVTIQRDRNGLNAGSFLIRSNDRTRQWLKEVIRRSLAINHPWHEQRVIQLLENEPDWDIYSVTDTPAFNQYVNSEYGWPKGEWRDWRPGDFAVTFPGLSVERREELVSYTLERSIP